MAIFKKKVTANQALTLAYGEVGYAEKPVNQTKYGVYFHMNGAQWCGLFVQWVWAQAGWKIGKDFPYTYYTPAGVAGWTKIHRIKKSGTPKPGDQLFFNFPNDSLDRVSHTGFFVGTVGKGVNKRWITIEGNTAGPKKISSDPRNGGEVAVCSRDPKFVVCWAEVPYTPAPTPIVDVIVKKWQEQNAPKPVKKVAKKVAKKTVKKVK